jgi:hypothetical protein
MASSGVALALAADQPARPSSTDSPFDDGLMTAKTLAGLANSPASSKSSKSSRGAKCARTHTHKGGVDDFDDFDDKRDIYISFIYLAVIKPSSTGTFLDDGRHSYLAGLAIVKPLPAKGEYCGAV